MTYYSPYAVGVMILPSFYYFRVWNQTIQYINEIFATIVCHYKVEARARMRSNILFPVLTSTDFVISSYRNDVVGRTVWFLNGHGKQFLFKFWTQTNKTYIYKPGGHCEELFD